jgi:ankyrin repeat protein
MKFITLKQMVLLLTASLTLHLNAEDSNSKLRFAAGQGNLDGVKQTLRDGANDVAVALEIAKNQDHTNIVALLNAWGTNSPETSEYLDQVEKQYLSTYSINGNLEAVKKALKLGATDTRSALCVAAKQGHLLIVQLLVAWDNGDASTPNSSDYSPLILSAGYGHTAVMRHLLNNGAPVDYKDAHRQTALHAACVNGHYEATKLLLEKRAKQDPRNQWGNTARDEAKSHGHTDIVALLDTYQNNQLETIPS